MSNIQLGFFGQEIAEKYLVSKGYKIIGNNFRSGKWGELDLIAKVEEVIVFIEVKTRNSLKFGDPEEAVSYFKQRNLKFAANTYLLRHNLLASPARFDVISVLILKDKPKLTHFVNCF